MITITRRSHANVNRINTYNMVDSKIDNPHLSRFALKAVVLAAHGVATRRNFGAATPNAIARDTSFAAGMVAPLSGRVRRAS